MHSKKVRTTFGKDSPVHWQLYGSSASEYTGSSTPGTRWTHISIGGVASNAPSMSLQPPGLACEIARENYAKLCALKFARENVRAKSMRKFLN